jgi:hypothetical protein
MSFGESPLEWGDGMKCNLGSAFSLQPSYVSGIEVLAIGVLGRRFHAASYKPNSERLDQFIKRKGGINECATRFSRWMGRGVAEE